MKNRRSLTVEYIRVIATFYDREGNVVIATTRRALKFASNPNRLNVAFTRPKCKLIVVGNGKVIVQNDDLLIYKFWNMLTI
ncbi:hypothetical protein J7L06_07260 [Candidatus Bathyarchaeota archaeon]|nr:hypothetical protein [Candidatus Bathyarchaeota archaeon]